jgi:hypothetical protein
MAITYVCRYWRSAALGLRELWSFITIPGFSLSWSQVMIERSSPLPMQIDLAICPLFEEGIEPLAASELLAASRIGTLHITGDSDDVLEVLNRIHSWPVLESLSIWITPLEGPLDFAVALLGKYMPDLHHLTFKSPARILAPLWLLMNITHFTTSTRISVDELLCALQEMPLLEVLSIVRIGNPWGGETPVSPPEHVTPPPRVVLPRLSLLSFRELCPNIFNLLSSRIEAPPTLRRHFFWEVSDVSAWYKWSRMLTDIQNFVPGDSAQDSGDGGLRFAQMGGYQCGWFEVWSRTYSGSASTATRRKDALFFLHVEWTIYDPSLTGFPNPSFLFTSACIRLLAVKIEDLTIAPAIVIENVHPDNLRTLGPLVITKKWQELLAELSSVKTLRLHDGDPACVSVLQALSTSEDPLLPHLQRVIVVNSTLLLATPARSDGIAGTGAGCSVASDDFVQSHVPVGVELVEVVSSRSGLEVVLAGCEVDEEALDALRKPARVYIGHERVYV